MKKLFALLIAVSLLSGCGLLNKITHKDDNKPTVENVYGASYMRFTMNKILGASQVDSMIVADHLTPLDEWIYIAISGVEKNTINQYMYIKSLEENNELIYTVTQTKVDTLYKCTKRITEKIMLDE